MLRQLLRPLTSASRLRRRLHAMPSRQKSISRNSRFHFFDEAIRPPDAPATSHAMRHTGSPSAMRAWPAYTPQPPLRQNDASRDEPNRCRRCRERACIGTRARGFQRSGILPEPRVISWSRSKTTISPPTLNTARHWRAHGFCPLAAPSWRPADISFADTWPHISPAFRCRLKIESAASTDGRSQKQYGPLAHVARQHIRESTASAVHAISNDHHHWLSAGDDSPIARRLRSKREIRRRRRRHLHHCLADVVQHCSCTIIGHALIFMLRMPYFDRIVKSFCAYYIADLSAQSTPSRHFI